MKAFDYQRELMNEGKKTLENIKAKWYGISVERKVTLMEVFTQHYHSATAALTNPVDPIIKTAKRPR